MISESALIFLITAKEKKTISYCLKGFELEIHIFSKWGSRSTHSNLELSGNIRLSLVQVD